MRAISRPLQTWPVASRLAIVSRLAEGEFYVSPGLAARLLVAMRSRGQDQPTPTDEPPPALTTREEQILEASLVAAFKIDDTMAQIERKLRNVGGAWKIADIASMTKDGR